MRFRIAMTDMPAVRPLKVVVVGCGGTGGFVAEGLCRLLPKDATLILIDHDRVEPHNLIRQNFVAGDVGRFKSQALAERFAMEYGRKVGYCVLPFTRHLHKASALGGSLQEQLLVNCLIIGCVDNAVARQEIRAATTMGNWWLDSGNGRNSGQVLLGNSDEAMFLMKAFHPQDQTVHALPLPSMQLPGLLIPAPAPKRDCAQAVADDEQSPVINQAMSVLVLDMMHGIITGNLTKIGMYLDLDAGSLSEVPADRETVARICGLDTDTLTDYGCGGRSMPMPPRPRRRR